MATSAKFQPRTLRSKNRSGSALTNLLELRTDLDDWLRRNERFCQPGRRPLTTHQESLFRPVTPPCVRSRVVVVEAHSRYSSLR